MCATRNGADRFTITLLDNGVHSLRRGIESYEAYDRTQDMMLLKDAIMQLHHGVELLMKEILVRHSPYLIFEDLRAAAKKQKEADENGIAIFFLDRPPRTVSFEEAINRVDAFVKPPELGNELTKDLDRLNRLRNQLEHYAIEADTEEVTQVLGALREPLLNLFEAQLEDIKPLLTPEVSRVWDTIQDSATRHVQLQREVFALVQQFNRQVVPGRLLNVEGDFTLPTFTRVVPEYQPPTYGFRLDIFAEGERLRWAIEVKAGRRLPTDYLHRFKSQSRIAEATPWLVMLADVPQQARELAGKLGILVTGAQEWQELKELVTAAQAQRLHVDRLVTVPQVGGSTMDPFIELPYGEPRAGFHVSQLITHIRSTGRDYIIQGQQHCTSDEHTKPQSLDMWLRRECAGRPDTCQAVNQVVDALVATGRFEVVKGLACPNSGRRVKGLRLVGPAGQQCYSRRRT